MSDTSSAGKRMRKYNEPVDLIEQVRARPCLWDRSCPLYRNRVAKETAWRDICRALHSDYDDLTPADKHEMGLMAMRKWYNIRDAYRKHYVARGSSATRPYLYASQLTFLIPVFNSTTKLDPIKCELVQEDEPDHEREEWLNVFEMDHVETSAPKRNKLERQHTRLKEPAEADDSILSALVNLVEKEEDEDRAFFRSITPAVKSLPDEHKFVFRIRVMKLLNNLRKECADPKTVKYSDASDSE